MPIVDREGAAIYYADAGDGPPMLFIHGGLHQPMNGARFWVGPGPAIDLVAADRRVLVPDRRWMGGGTTAGLAVHTWQLEADDMAAAINDAHGGLVDVIAGSNGCSVGLRLTIDHPDLVRTLVLCWPAAPHRREGAAAFVNLAKRVEADGPTVLGTADPSDAAGRTAGVAPWEAAATDDRFRESLAEFDNATAAAIVRDSAAALFAGDLIRGVDESETATIAEAGRSMGDPVRTLRPLARRVNVRRGHALDPRMPARPGHARVADLRVRRGARPVRRVPGIGAQPRLIVCTESTPSEARSSASSSAGTV